MFLKEVVQKGACCIIKRYQQFFVMVGGRRIELLTSSVSRKRSTSELIAQRDEILLANVRPVNSLSGFGALPSQL